MRWKWQYFNWSWERGSREFCKLHGLHVGWLVGAATGAAAAAAAALLKLANADVFPAVTLDEKRQPGIRTHSKVADVAAFAAPCSLRGSVALHTIEIFIALGECTAKTRFIIISGTIKN